MRQCDWRKVNWWTWTSESAHAERGTCHSWTEVGSGHSCWCWLVSQRCDKACARLMPKLVPPTRSLDISNCNNRAQKVDHEASADARSRVASTQLAM